MAAVAVTTTLWQCTNSCFENITLPVPSWQKWWWRVSCSTYSTVEKTLLNLLKKIRYCILILFVFLLLVVGDGGGGWWLCSSKAVVVAISLRNFFGVSAVSIIVIFFPSVAAACLPAFADVNTADDEAWIILSSGVVVALVVVLSSVVKWAVACTTTPVKCNNIIRRDCGGVVDGSRAGLQQPNNNLQRVFEQVTEGKE